MMQTPLGTIPLTMACWSSWPITAMCTACPRSRQWRWCSTIRQYLLKTVLRSRPLTMSFWEFARSWKAMESRLLRLLPPLRTRGLFLSTFSSCPTVWAAMSSFLALLTVQDPGTTRLWWRRECFFRRKFPKDTMRTALPECPAKRLRQFSSAAMRLCILTELGKPARWQVLNLRR